ncbi:major head protein [Escherchia phage Stokescottia]
MLAEQAKRLTRINRAALLKSRKKSYKYVKKRIVSSVEIGGSFVQFNRDEISYEAIKALYKEGYTLQLSNDYGTTILTVIWE